LLFYPDSSPTFRNVDRYPNATARDRAYKVFKALDTLDPLALGASLDVDRRMPFLGLEHDAQDLFDGWRAELETRLRSGKESTLLTCHLAKYRKLLPALALVFHLVESHASSRLDPISMQAIAAAAAWCDLLEVHARRVYQAAFDGDPEAAMHLAERIKASLSNPFTFRQVAQKGWSGLATVEEVRKAVGMLEDRNWLKVVEVPPSTRGGRPSEQVWINPAIRNP
jgi:putative DNA primase/helicase